jgi:hypothetical protein
VAGLDQRGDASKGPTQLLSVLSGQAGQPAWVTPALGEMWLAAGIQFQSFKLINGRALLVAKLGARFELTLLGLATLQIPQEEGGGDTATPYAYAELALEAVLAPDDGVFSVIAQLTPESYLLSRACHLTGGFAFCLWFGANPHAGDFVLTIGGYHPAFDPPPHYPKVPAVGVRWTVDDELTVAGTAYFAITPAAAMAGAGIQVNFQSGALRAWLTAHADILVRWNPFYVTAGIGLSVGVSYRLDLGFTTVDLGVEIGAQLDLWGPPTGGTVHVDWHIISFTIGFGEGPKPPDSLVLDWGQFQALLPGQSDQQGGTTETAIVVTISVSRGLSRTDDVTGAWIVRPDELILTVASAVPLTSVTFGGPVIMPDKAPKTINIRPMAQPATSSLEITMDGADLTGWPRPDIATASWPAALWGHVLADKEPLNPAEPPIGNLPAALTFAPPPVTARGGFVQVAADKLTQGVGETVLPFGLVVPVTGVLAVGDGSISAIAGQLTDPDAAGRQQAIVDALKVLHADPPASGPLTRLGQQAEVVFTETPMLTGGTS